MMVENPLMNHADVRAIWLGVDVWFVDVEDGYKTVEGENEIKRQTKNEEIIWGMHWGIFWSENERMSPAK